MKKTIAVFLALLMMIGIFPLAFAEPLQIEERAVPFYVMGADNEAEEAFPLVFVGGVEDLPWVELKTWAGWITELFADDTGDSLFDLDYEEAGSVVSLSRDTGYDMVLDFENDTVSFTDFNGFLFLKGRDSLLDILGSSGFNEEGEASLFLRNHQASFERYGDKIDLSLRDYGIDLLEQDGRFFVPLQTLNDLVLFPMISRGFLFNGEMMAFANGGDLVDQDTGEITDLGELWFSVQPRSLSPQLAEFNYNELCFALDVNYGLKEPHNIKNFRQTFWEIGFDEALSSTDPADFDLALHQFINYYLDDQHSSFTAASGYSDPDRMEAHEEITSGTAATIMETHMMRYALARLFSREDMDFPGYEEVGNTAYVTFDGFNMLFDTEDYYAHALEDDEPMPDTIGLITYAHSQIKREGSPIKNVVIDLSNNTGGAADVAIFVISWVLGDGAVNVKNTFTGAMSNQVYSADVNLDRTFDEQDTLYDKNVYCLISPVSFSCGNLVPAVLKASQVVTLLGTKSGGGSCVVQPMCSASGTTFNISGQSRLSFLKNGSFYDIDQGIDPDYPISNIMHYYDREALTDYINNLF